MRTNIDHAIASVIERGEELDIPNVFSAYFQHILAHEAPDSTIPGTDSLAQTALASFERAMDKYPMPPPLTNTTTTKTSNAKTSPPSRSDFSKATGHVDPLDASRMGKKLYCAEVAKLRLDYYQQAMGRVAAFNGNRVCSCISCGSLLSLQEQAASLIAQYKELEQQITAFASKAKRRVRKCKKRTAKKAAMPLDPYAPSTSAAML